MAGFGVGAAVIAGVPQVLWRAFPLWWLPAALASGHLLFALSCLLNRLSFRYGVENGWRSVRLLYRPYGLETMGFYLILSLGEELIFRAVPLSLLAPGWPAVAGFAGLFSLAHLLSSAHERRLLRVVDLFGFGCALGWLFIATGSVWPVVLVHWVRNVSVAKAVLPRQRAETPQSA